MFECNIQFLLLPVIIWTAFQFWLYYCKRSCAYQQILEDWDFLILSVSQTTCIWYPLDAFTQKLLRWLVETVWVGTDFPALFNILLHVHISPLSYGAGMLFMALSLWWAVCSPCPVNCFPWYVITVTKNCVFRFHCAAELLSKLPWSLCLGLFGGHSVTRIPWPISWLLHDCLEGIGEKNQCKASFLP